MKASAMVPCVLLALACGSKSEDQPGHDGSGAAPGSGGSTMIAVTGGTSGTGTGGDSSASGGTSGTNGTITMETAEDLRKKACAGWSSEPELLPIVLMLVVDTSASMNERPGGGRGGDTKWTITRDALGSAVDGLPPTAAVGVLYFPNEDTRASDVPRPVSECVNTQAMIPIGLLGDAGSAQRDAIASSLRRTEPAGSTPTHDAYDYALVNGMQASQLTGNRFMLLITDGAPTLGKDCQGGGLPTTPAPTQPIIDEVLAARQDGIRSFIIGSPGSERVNGVDVRPWMSEAAVLGGTAPSGCSLDGPDFCHIDLSQDPDFAGALNAALARILGLLTSCAFEVPATGKDGQPVNRDQINVIYTPGDGSDEVLLGYDAAPGCQDGWQFDDTGRVVLCPHSCFQAQNDPDSQVELLFGCDSVPTGPIK